MFVVDSDWPCICIDGVSVRDWIQCISDAASVHAAAAEADDDNDDVKKPELMKLFKDAAVGFVG